MANVYCQIKDLTMSSHSFFLNTLIIAKSEQRLFAPGRNGGVITFTVRDTKDHFINCTVWGSEQFIKNCARAYKIGDIISIYQPKVLLKNSGSNYNPRTTSPFELSVNEGKSYIHRAIEQTDYLLRLRNQAVKPTSLALKLDDLVCRPGSDSVTADVVVLVRGVEPPRSVQTKFGEKTVRKVCLMDRTTELVSMVVWNPEYQARMELWKPMETILQLVDIRFEYSSFERSTVLSITSRTIIIENPANSSRSNEIMAHIHSISVEKYNELKSNKQKSIGPDAIKDVMSVHRIRDEMERDPTKEIAAIVYGVITKFDINAAIVKSCVNCKKLLLNRNECGMPNCDSIQSNGPRYVDKVYMAVSVTDHSGTLNCRIVDEHAQHILGHSAQGLKSMAEDDVDAIFNKFILERFAVKLIVRFKSKTEYFASIVSIETHNSHDVAEVLKP
ncbi:protein hold'em-like [Contarinia nasturtii]|uniref:protein hold'em-like n=1 Tax=Contarinia nasturtii TaxID=265458 RepID=UPI0012D4B1D2|nr:protein hold'em-like [Contarinia nasturtii]